MSPRTRAPQGARHGHGRPAAGCLVLAAALAGCASPEPPPRPAGECDAGPAHTVVGRRLTPELQEEARAISGAEIVRTLVPGQVITMEFNPRRLNLQLNRDYVVTRATCG